MFILTNNPYIGEHITGMEVVFLDTGYVGVLEECRNYIHKNHKLLTHPLYGSVKPNETLFRTVVIEKCTSLDINSLTLIEEAIYTAKKFLKNRAVRDWPESIVEDFMVLDLDIIKNAVKRI